MKKLILLVTLVVVLSMAAVMPAAAGWTWCSTDPIVTLPDGGTVNIFVEVPEGATIDLDLWVPRGSTVQPQPSGFTLDLKIHEWKDANSIRAKVHTDDKVPVRLSAFHNGNPLGGQEFDKGKGSIQWSW